MNGFPFLMFIFGFFIFLAGIYLYTGHNSEFLLWKHELYKTITKKELKNLGKWTMISSLIPIILGLIVLIFNIE